MDFKQAILSGKPIRRINALEDIWYVYNEKEDALIPFNKYGKKKRNVPWFYLSVSDVMTGSWEILHEWQDEERTYTPIERVLDCRLDCRTMRRESAL